MKGRDKRMDGIDGKGEAKGKGKREEKRKVKKEKKRRKVKEEKRSCQVTELSLVGLGYIVRYRVSDL